MAEFIIKRIKDLNTSEKNAVDKFIINPDTNGEFINTIKYLDYHPLGRFQDESICIQEKGSRSIVGVMMAAISSDNDCIVSHPGTTFAGPIIKRCINVQYSLEVLKLLMEYYETRYDKIIIRTAPAVFGNQPNGLIDYYLSVNGYKYEISALSNVIDLTGINCENDVVNMFDGKKRNKLRKNLQGDKIFIYKKNLVDQTVWQSINENLENKFSTRTTHTWEEIADLVNRFPKDIDVFYADDKEGEYCAFSLNYRFKTVYHTQYMGLNYEKRVYNPNVYLIYHLMTEAKKQGFKYFSFGASTEKQGQYLNTGLFEYKAGYGGGEIILPRYKKEMGGI